MFKNAKQEKSFTVRRESDLSFFFIISEYFDFLELFLGSNSWFECTKGSNLSVNSPESGRLELEARSKLVYRRFARVRF